jgi:hypothetical protein
MLFGLIICSLIESLPELSASNAPLMTLYLTELKLLT